MRRSLTLIASAAMPLALVLPATGASAAPGSSEAARLCQDGGYTRYQRSDGSRFANQGACVSYASRGGQLVSIPTRSLTIRFEPSDRPGVCDTYAELRGFEPNTDYLGSFEVPGDAGLAGLPTTDATGAATVDLSAFEKGIPLTLSYGGVSVTETVAC